MSIANHYNGVARFQQSLECKLKGCSNENVSYNFAGYKSHGNYHIQGIPIRSCGCKAEKAFNRLRPTLSQMRDLFGKCYRWDGIFVGYTDKNWRDNKFNIALHFAKYHINCWEEAKSYFMSQDRMFYQTTFSGHDEEENIHQERGVHFPNEAELLNSLKGKNLNNP